MLAVHLGARYGQGPRCQHHGLLRMFQMLGGNDFLVVQASCWQPWGQSYFRSLVQGQPCLCDRDLAAFGILCKHLLLCCPISGFHRYPSNGIVLAVSTALLLPISNGTSYSFVSA
jgi:hypothetical protein